MFEIIVGNVCSIGAMIFDSISSTKNKNKDMLLMQCFSQGFYFAGSFILKGYSACVQNVVGIIRNIFAGNKNSNKYLEILLVILPVILGVYFNNRGLLGILPVAANLEYSICMFAFKNDSTALRISFAFNMVAFTIFNLFIFNYVSALSNAITSITTIISLIKDTKKGA